MYIRSCAARGFARQEWDRLNQEVINRLIESMPSRIRQVINRSGEVTKY